MKTRFVHLSLVTGLCLNTWAQVVSPANPIVRQGETLQFTADRPVRWSLVPGSAGVIDQSGGYHAPASVKASAAIGGCQIGAPDSIFNTRIDNLPVHANSAVWMAALPQPTIGILPSWGTNIGDHTTPVQTLVFNYTPAYNSLPFEIPAWPLLKRENGVFSDPLTDVDRHILTVDRETCREYNIYNNYPAGTGGNQAPASTYTAQSGWQYPTMSYSLPTAGGTDAAGMPLAPTTLTLDDIHSGVIRHAMRVTFGNSYIAPAFVWPATTNAGAFGFVPYGTRFRLKAGFDVTRFSPTAQIILTGLKQYGMMISDGGGNWDIIAATDVTEDRAVQAALLEIINNFQLIDSNQIEVVDESSLMVSSSSSRIAYNNPYVTPPAFAIAKADDGVDPPVSVAIALQGVALNSPEGGGVWIQSGVTKTLTVFAGGAVNTAVTWKMNPALGTLNAISGVYFAPSVGVPTTTSITATSVADPTASIAFPLTVLPAGPIRISAGDATGNTAAPNSHAPDYGPDSNGNLWWRDQAVERGWGVKNDYWYGSPWPTTPDIYLYETQYYDQGDTVYRFSVPNGNYDIDYYVAQGDCGPTNTRDPLLYREHLEAQGQIGAHDFRPLAITGGRCFTPVHTTIPAQVTDNNLYFALRRITDHTQSEVPVSIISAFSVTPSVESPHLTMDPNISPTLTVSQNVQLYAIGWFMSNSVSWSLDSGPGNVDLNGVYTAPSTPTTGFAVVRATSTVNPSQFATIRINLAFGTVVLTPSVATLNRSATQQIAASIGNQTYSNVTWTVTGVGWISSDGLYTAPDVLAQPQSVTITAISKDDPTQTATATLTILANVPPIRVNCGGFGFIDAQGRIWADDYGFSLPSLSYAVADVAIARTTPDLYPLYDSYRYVYQNQTFYYDFPLPNGEYELTLKFGDYSFDTPGIYNFDVQINGVTVLTNFDPDAVYGAGKTAVDKTFVVFVSNKDLRITLVSHSGAFLNGIEILPTSFVSRRISGLAGVRGRTK